MFLNNCQREPTYYEELYAKTFLAVKDDIKTRLIEAEKYARIGNREQAQKRYDQVNNWYYLMYYSTLLQMEYAQAFSNGRTEVTMETLLEKYQIDCIRKQFACEQMDADLVLKLFGIGSESGIMIMGIDSDTIPFTPHPVTEQPL